MHRNWRQAVVAHTVQDWGQVQKIIYVFGASQVSTHHYYSLISKRQDRNNKTT